MHNWTLNSKTHGS